MNISSKYCICFHTVFAKLPDVEMICFWLFALIVVYDIYLFELTKYGLLGRLLIWEDYYYEPLPSPFPPRDGEGCWFSSESQLIQEEDRVCVLINKMMVNNSVSIAGEGLVLSIFIFSLLYIIFFCRRWQLFLCFPMGLFN